MIDFLGLDPTIFEELCFDILRKKGFTNISWRKGTGKKTSPSDSGRDIEANLLRKDFDGTQKLEKYFFECKHYYEGIPPTAIEGAISWAIAERPQYLVIIASNFLSNPCKDYIEQYRKNNNPPYEIRIWENKILELFLSDMPDICAKYNLNNVGLNLKYINKFHLAYVIKPRLNTIDFLLELLDNYEPQKRDNILSMTYHEVIKPRYRNPKSRKEKIKELLLDDVSYDTFKMKLIALKSEVQPPFVHEIVSEALAWAFSFADISEQDIIISRNIRTKEYIQEKMKIVTAPDKNKDNQRMIKFIDKSIDGMPARFKKYNEDYNDFCNVIISQLLEEP